MYILNLKHNKPLELKHNQPLTSTRIINLPGQSLAGPKTLCAIQINRELNTVPGLYSGIGKSVDPDESACDELSHQDLHFFNKSLLPFLSTIMNFIDGQTISLILQYDRLIPAMETALCQFSANRVVQPVRSVVPVEKEGGFLGLMPALCEDEGILATKLVTFFPHNQGRHGVSTHNGVIVVFHTHTGIPRAILDAEVITARRTAAVSALATKYLAPAGVEKLAILGAGVQARSHHAAITSIMGFTQVSVWSRTYDSAVACASDIGGKACRTAEEAVQNADVIVTVTGATTPILLAGWVKPGAHVNAVGACRPDWSEVDPALMTSSVLYVDSREAALVESGDVILSKAEIYAELGEIILGQKEAHKDKTTIFKSLGMAIEDSMSAKLVLDLLSSQEQT